jgi:hypothetical protein
MHAFLTAVQFLLHKIGTRDPIEAKIASSFDSGGNSDIRWLYIHFN